MPCTDTHKVMLNKGANAERSILQRDVSAQMLRAIDRKREEDY